MFFHLKMNLRVKQFHLACKVTFFFRTAQVFVEKKQKITSKGDFLWGSIG